MTRKNKMNPEEEVGQENIPGATEVPTDVELALAQEVAQLANELEDTKAKMDEYLQGWQRVLADFSNYKRRVERDQAQASQAAAGNILKRYLDVVDDLDRALKNRPQQGEGAAWSNGIELIYRKLLTFLETEGVKTIEAEGQTFDPNLHEAISMEENQEYASGQVIGVVQQGYTLGERVLRPARVRVAR